MQLFKCALKVGLPGALEGIHFKNLRVFTLERNKNFKKLCFSIHTIFCKWLILIVISLGVSWAHFEWYLSNGIAFSLLQIFWSEFIMTSVHNMHSMHNFTPIQYFYITATLYILCLFFCLVSVTLVKITDQNFYYKARINIRAIQIIFCHYFYENVTSNVKFNLYLFKRAIFDVI